MNINIVIENIPDAIALRYDHNEHGQLTQQGADEMVEDIIEWAALGDETGESMKASLAQVA